MTNTPENAIAVAIIPRTIWIESDLFGGRHVVCKDEGFSPFTYATFYYNYAFTSNAGTWADAVKLAISLGAAEPVAERMRANNFAETMAKRRVDEEEYKSWFIQPAA